MKSQQSDSNAHEANRTNKSCKQNEKKIASILKPILYLFISFRSGIKRHVSQRKAPQFWTAGLQTLVNNEESLDQQNLLHDLQTY